MGNMVEACLGKVAGVTLTWYLSGIGSLWCFISVHWKKKDGPISAAFPFMSGSRWDLKASRRNMKLATQKKYGLIRAILSRSITRDEKRIRTKIFSFLNEKLCDHIEIIIIITFIMPKFYIMIKCAIPSHLICARRSTIDWKRNASRKKTIQLRFIARKLIQNWWKDGFHSKAYN